MNKREAREILFSLVFESEFHPRREADEIYETARAERGFENFRYIKKGLRDIIENRERITAAIEPRSDGWKVSRMTPATRSVLFVGVYDMVMKNTAPSIAINEAVEIAKKYAEDDSAPFVNGILNSIAGDAEEIKANFAADLADDWEGNTDDAARACGGTDGDE